MEGQCEEEDVDGDHLVDGGLNALENGTQER